MFRPTVVTHRVPSQTKEFSSHSVMCYSFRVTLQIATARFCTPLQRVAMNTPRFRNSLPMPASPLVIDAATAADLRGRSLQTWWSWHAAGRCPQPVTRPHQTLTVVVVRRDRRIRGLNKSTFKAIVDSLTGRVAVFLQRPLMIMTAKLRSFPCRCWAQCIRISPEFSRCHCPTKYRSFRNCEIIFPIPVNSCLFRTGNVVNLTSVALTTAKILIWRFPGMMQSNSFGNDDTETPYPSRGYRRPRRRSSLV